MKKLFAIIAVCLTYALMLTACASRAEKLKDKYDKESYSIVNIEGRDIRTYGIAVDKVKMKFAAIKDNDVAFVVEYKSGDDAKDLYDRLRNKESMEGMVIDGLNYDVIKKNNTVIFGTKDAVELAK